MAHRIDYPGSQGYNKTYDCIVETEAELTTDPELIALDPFAMAISLNTDVGPNAKTSFLIKLPDGTWKKLWG